MTSSSERHRLFFALWPKDEVRAGTASATREVVAASGGRPVPTANLHITLAFLGEVAPAQLAAASAIGAQVEGRCFELTLDQIETFPGARVLCLTASRVPEAAASLAERLRFKLLESNLKLSDQKFRPHVTLARDVPKLQRPAPFPPLQWPVSEFVLVESQRGRGGSAYEVLERWALQQRLAVGD